MIAFKNRLKETIYDRLKGVFPVTREDLDMAPTPDPKKGDLALTFPFALAKTIDRNFLFPCGMGLTASGSESTLPLIK